MFGQHGFPGPQFQWKYTNFNVPGTAMGTSVGLGTSGAEGSWVQVASSANVADDVYLIAFGFTTNFTSGANVNTCVDIGVDPAGGSSYTEVIQNIICGKNNTSGFQAHSWFVFPLFVKAGSSIAVRGSTSYTASPSCRALLTIYGQPRNPHLVRVGQYAEGVGTITSNAGVSFTPGNAAEGSWASLGTTTRDCWWWQLGADIGNSTITAHYTHIDLAVGDGSNKHIIIENIPIFVTGTTEFVNRNAFPQIIEGYWEVPAGATLYVRGHSNAAPISGYNARAIGIGG